MKNENSVKNGCSKNLYTQLTAFALLLFLCGCQPRVYLMPPPVSIKSSKFYFNLSQDNKDENLLYTLYATNRQPYEKMSGQDGYTIFPSDDLRIGLVVHSVGEEGMSWEELHDLSTKDERDEELLLNQVYVRERATVAVNKDPARLSSGAEGLFEQINRVLERSFSDDLLVYVHGANSSFYRATAQGAQVFHFTGHNLVVLTFSWPSAENILKYKTDVLHAKKTVPAFAHLLETLALHTNAKKINIVVYSAGAQVAAPGLEYLRDKYLELTDEQLKAKLRIGEVYFAAPDIAFGSFVDRYLKFKDFVDRTTINLNQHDSVLRMAAFQNGVSRLGRPDSRDLTDAEKQIILRELATPELDVLNVGDSKPLGLGGAHNSWYGHPWVSNDLLLLLLFNATPEERGLEEYTIYGDAKGYLFPDRYDEIISEIIEQNSDELDHRVRERESAMQQ